LVSLFVDRSSAPPKTYQQQRILMFNNLELARAARATTSSSRRSVGSGMPGEDSRGTQNHLNFPRAAHRLHLLGLLRGFGWPARPRRWRSWGCCFELSIAARTRDRFGVLLCLGIMSILFWQVVVNVGMVTGLMPVVGVPLPFFSYGGSSLFGLLVGIGLVMNVSMRRHLF
jgi:rod shape determining protein RodA